MLYQETDRMEEGSRMSHGDMIRVFYGGVAIITGGASGIGRAFGEALAARGCEVVLGDLQIELAEEVAVGINASGGQATAVEVDVVNHEDVVNLVQQTVERCGRLDYMFNNAGIVIFGEASEYGIHDWERSIDVNLRGVIHGVDAAYRVMLKQGFGHIINTASIAGLMPWPMEIGYSTTKHAVVGLTTTLRAEAGHAGIRVSALCPGLVRTPILHGGKYGRWIRDYPKDKVAKLMESTRPFPVGKFVELALKQIARNKAIIVIPLMYGVLWRTYRLWPLLGIAMSRILFHAMRKQLKQFGSQA
jgi:NAD(P)-dependent dehydrogenase (short-subunit alcohol dehydrogenase family)